MISSMQEWIHLNVKHAASEANQDAAIRNSHAVCQSTRGMGNGKAALPVNQVLRIAAQLPSSIVGVRACDDH